MTTYTIHPVGWATRRRVLWQILTGQQVTLPAGIVTEDLPLRVTFGTGGLTERRYPAGGYADGQTIVAGGGASVQDHTTTTGGAGSPHTPGCGGGGASTIGPFAYPEPFGSAADPPEPGPGPR